MWEVSLTRKEDTDQHVYLICNTFDISELEVVNKLLLASYICVYTNRYITVLFAFRTDVCLNVVTK